jgi:hypothetical protein
LANSANYETPHFAVFSSLVSLPSLYIQYSTQLPVLKTLDLCLCFIVSDKYSLYGGSVHREAHLFIGKYGRDRTPTLRSGFGPAIHVFWQVRLFVRKSKGWVLSLHSINYSPAVKIIFYLLDRKVVLAYLTFFRKELCDHYTVSIFLYSIIIIIIIIIIKRTWRPD